MSIPETFNLESFNREELHIYNELKNRKEILKSELTKEMTINLTVLGNEIKKEKIDQELIESLTPSLLKSEYWKGKKFRRYQINSEVPKVYAGRVHFTNEALRYVRKIWLDMGFQEMKGSKMQTSFWNFDALFTAQDHPVREMQDTFFIKNPEKGKLPENSLVERIKKVHEDGGNTGSLGWKYNWNSEDGKKNVLRTHTTALSAKTIAGLKLMPGKYFAIARCFRPDVVDATHNADFNHVEGFVIEEGVANFLSISRAVVSSN